MRSTALSEWWLPPHRFPDESAELRARATGVMLTAGTAALLIGTMGIVELVLGGTFGWLMLGVSAVLVALMLVFRRRGDVTVFDHAVVGAAVLGIGALMALSGGRATGGAMILPLLVLLAMLVLPGRQGLWWAGASLAIVLGAFWMVRTGAAAWVAPEPSWVASAGYRVPSALCVLGAAFGMYFMRSYRGVLDGLERSRRREAELLRITTLQKERFTDFAMVAADWFWETDADDRLTHVSPGFGAAFGLSNEEMVGATPVEIARRLLPESVRDSAVDPLAGRADFSGQRLLAISADGERRILSNSGRALWSREGEFLGYRGAATDITELQGLNDELRRMAGTDPLTGLANRRALAAAVTESLGGYGWLLFMDLDGFKRINDEHGHDAGDAALREVAAALSHCARDVDLVARLGGDEFAILLLNDKQRAAELVAARVLEDVARLAATDPRFAGLGVSIGIAPTLHAITLDDALGKADAACYAAKRSGRHRYVNA